MNSCAGSAKSSAGCSARWKSWKYAAADFLFVPGAESLGDGNGKPGTQAETQADDQEVDGAGGTDGSQAFRPEEPADYGRIHKAVQLLKQYAEQHGQRKGENQFQGASFRQVAGHIPGHTDKPLSAVFSTARKVIALFVRVYKGEDFACFPDRKAMFFKIKKRGRARNRARPPL